MQGGRVAVFARIAALAGVLGGILALPAGAQLPLPLGLDGLVNLSLLGEQDESAVAVDLNGDFVVVWRHELLPSLVSTIRGRKFSARTGLPLTAEFPISFKLIGDQRNPAIAMGADGRFVVTWESPDTILPSSRGVFGTLRNADASVIVSEFQVNTTKQGVQRRPAVAMQPNGGFLVAWQDDFAFTEGDTGENIVARLYPPSFPKNPPGTPFPINTVLSGDQERPAAAPLPTTGGWLVAWQGPFSPSNVPSILVRSLTAGGGGPAEVPVNTSTTQVDREHVALSSNASGDAVAVWHAPDESFRGIYSRRLGGGVPTGVEEQVNLTTDRDEREPTVAMDERGGFVTAWVVASPALGDAWASPEGSPIVIQGRKKNQSAGFAPLQPPPSDGEFQVNTSGSTFVDPGVAAEPNGNFVAVWPATEGEDDDGSGVYFRRFRDAIFADDFETEDTSRWSAAIP
jgi:hypothetical protein